MARLPSRPDGDDGSDPGGAGGFSRPLRRLDRALPEPCRTGRRFRRDGRAAERTLSPGHRHDRPRSAHPPHLRLPSLARDGDRGARDRNADRRRGRPSRRLSRAGVELRLDALDRRLSLNSSAGSGDVDHRLSRAERNPRNDSDHCDVVAVVRAPCLQSDARREAGGLCRGGGDCRRQSAAHSLSRNPAELHAVDPHQDDGRRRLRHSHRLVNVVSRPRRPGADARSRLDGRRWREIHA